jgi:hypothetical protein
MQNRVATQTITISARRGLKAPGLLKVLRAHADDLLPLLPPMRRHHYRAELVDGSFVVDAVEHYKGSIYSVSFSYNWWAGSGCRDDQGGDWAFDSAHFAYRDGVIEFEYSEPETRYPKDEF